MKIIFAISFVVLTSCNIQPQNDVRIHQAEEEMDNKVQTIIQQLREDCDSSLMQLARIKADSFRIKNKIVKRLKH